MSEKKEKKEKRGCKPILEITDKVLKKVRKMSGNGLTQEQIYSYYGMKKSAWYKLKKNHPELQKAYRKGKSKRILFVTNKLMNLINEGNITAILFYLKTQAGWREKDSRDDENDIKSRKTVLRIETVDPIEASKIYQQIMTGSHQ